MGWLLQVHKENSLIIVNHNKLRTQPTDNDIKKWTFIIIVNQNKLRTQPTQIMI